MHKTIGSRALEIGLFAAAAMVVAFVCMPREGILLTHDSLAYLYAADTFSAGEGFVYFGYSTPMVQWPLFMPLLLAFIGLFTANVTTVMAYVNIVFLGATVVFGGLIIYKLIGNRLVRLCAMTALSFSLYFFRLYYYLFSEAPFLLFLMMLTYFILCYLEHQKARYLCMCALTAGLLMWTRFVGLEMAGLVGLLLLFQKKPWRKKIVDLVVYGGVGCLPFGLLLLRNLVLSTTMTGRSKPSRTPFGDNVKNTFTTFARWFVPEVSGMWAAIVLAAVGLFAVIAILFIVRRRDFWKNIPHLPVVLLLAVHTLAYPAMVIYSNTVYALDPVGYRILAPMHLTSLILLFIVIDQLLAARPLGKTGMAAAKTVVVGATLAVAAFHLAGIVSTCPPMKGYFHRSNFEKDELIAFVSTLDPETSKVYTNRPAEITFMTDVEANYTPRKEGIPLYVLEGFYDRFDPDKSNYLVWWEDPNTNPILYAPEQMEAMFDLKLVRAFASGAIYRFP